MKMKKLLSLTMATALLVSTAACSTPQEAPSGNASSTPTSTGEAPKKITITAATTLNPDNRESDPIVKTFYDSWDRFLADNPNVTLDHEYIPHDAYQEKAQILATGDELPDIFEMKGSWTRNWVENGRVLSLNSMLDNNPEWKETLEGGAASAFTVDGKIYGLTTDGGGLTSLVFYNQDIFNECGITEFPKNIAEFNTAIEKIKAKGYTPISLGNVANWPAESCIFSTLMSRTAGEAWVKDLLKYDGTADFTNPKFTEALGILETWAKMGAFNSDVNSIDYHQARVGYYDKKAAMSIDGFWAINSIIKDAPQDVIDATRIAMIPIDPPAGDIEVFEGGGWAVSTNAKVAEDADKLAVIEQWYKEYFSVSTANTMYEMGKIPSIKTPGYDKSKLHRLQNDYYELFAKTPQYTVIDLYFSPSLVETLNTSLQELLIQKVSTQEIANRVQAEYAKGAN